MVTNAFGPKNDGHGSFVKAIIPLVLYAIIKAVESTMKLRANILCRLNLSISYKRTVFQLRTLKHDSVPHAHTH